MTVVPVLGRRRLRSGTTFRPLSKAAKQPRVEQAQRVRRFRGRHDDKVSFAEQLLEQGRTITQAAIEAAELRLRPILMTSIAFILGVGPLYFATGAGAYGRHSVGTAIMAFQSTGLSTSPTS